MIGFRHRSGAGLDVRVVGRPAVTLLIGFGSGDLVVDGDAGRQVVGGFVSGITNGAMRVRGDRAECIEVRLSPLTAGALLGPVATGLGVVGLEEIWGVRARRLRERLAEAADWDERFALTGAFLREGAEAGRAPRPEIVTGWRRIVATRGQVTVRELAQLCGWSRKRLWAGFESEIGLTPKRAAMLVRFRHAVDALVAGGRAAAVAADCGYSDQSHLGRDLAGFADLTPGMLAGQPLAGFPEHRHRTWGTFVL